MPCTLTRQWPFRSVIPRGISLSVTDYEADVTVVPTDDNSCRIDWEARATPTGVSDEEAAEMVNGVYSMMLQWIEERLQKNS